MPTIYLDHNVVHYYVRGFPKTGPISEDAERTALTRARGFSGDVRFVISDWNLVEASREKEPAPATTPETLVRRYVEFFQSLHPLYLAAREAIEREEMRRLVLAHLGLPCPSEGLPVFNETFLQACAVSQHSDELLLGYDAERFLLDLARHPEMRATHYRPAEERSHQAQLDIRKAQQRGLYGNPKLEFELHRRWFRQMMPDRGTDGRTLSLAGLDALAQTFAADRQAVFDACPAIWSESAVTDIRANVGGRTPKIQDAIDLMHAVLPLAYCDALISDDRHFRRCAQGTLKATGRNMVVTNRLSDALAKLGV
jgi:hypothetical protein